MRKKVVILTTVLILTLQIIPLYSAPLYPASGWDPYADAVISYTPGPGVSGGNDNPAGALGAPEYDSTSGSGLFVSLGNGGLITLAFIDNIVIDGPGPDLSVIEVGDSENGTVSVSNDGGISFVSLGTSVGQTSFDLEGTGLSFVNAIKIVDLPPNTSDSPYAGFDLDAVIGLNAIPEPATLLLLGLGGLAVLRKHRS